MNMGWCGDFSGDWKGLKLQIQNIYQSAKRGYGSPGCEVAGFFMKRSNKEQFVRYAQFGCMTACMINGGENGAFSNHLPWWHGTDVEEIYRYCVVLHDELIPYLFSTVVDAHLHGGSLIKMHLMRKKVTRWEIIYLPKLSRRLITVYRFIFLPKENGLISMMGQSMLQAV